jgi:hypothetical protein
MGFFIFMAGILVRNMDGVTDTKNFLSFKPTTTLNDTLMDNEEGQQQQQQQQQFYIEAYLLATILCYIASASAGVMIVPWTLISELFPIEVSETHELDIDAAGYELKIDPIQHHTI